MNIENRWKRFAVGHHFSEFEGDGVALYDELMEADDDEDAIQFVLDKYEAVVWERVETDFLGGLRGRSRAWPGWLLQHTSDGETYSDPDSGEDDE